MSLLVDCFHALSLVARSWQGPRSLGSGTFAVPRLVPLGNCNYSSMRSIMWRKVLILSCCLMSEDSIRCAEGTLLCSS